MDNPGGDRAPKGERSLTAGICKQCGAAFHGRQRKVFCADKCRTKFGREQRTRGLAETIARLAELAGVSRP